MNVLKENSHLHYERNDPRLFTLALSIHKYYINITCNLEQEMISRTYSFYCLFINFGNHYQRIFFINRFHV